MSDDTENPGTNGTGPKRILSLGDHLAKRPSKKARDTVTKDELVAAMAAGSLAMGQKVYDQISARTAEHLGAMEAELRAEFDAKLEALRAELIPPVS